jgi:DNA-directed RNA polymerase subunit F
MKIIKSRPVPLSEAKELLEERKKNVEELGYEQAQAAEHAEKFSRSKASEAEKLAASLAKDSGLDSETAIKIVDLSPKHPETVKAILIRNKIDLPDEEIEKLLKSLK